ncbi:patatin-like phospholipase family protein [Salipaludibacillus agaradhaerens]|uniref:patatin-like phospholipase family protein n=1 Tax=Salipaludibacillus agaradhaerens TaxID=76935 RepID=UPI0009984E81|nr:patatin family protein [Salipaludibacillus agaradhaerens]
MTLDKTGLVLEGGGMRGVFTGGILEFFMDNDIHFPYIVGVSAGACNAASYVSRQPGRNKAITVEYANHPDYISYKRLFRSGELFNMDLIFEQIPNKENPFDYYRFFQSKQKFYVGVTDCRTGETVYYEKTEIKEEFNKVLRASSSLPFVAPVVTYKNRILLDGGISDPIPVKQSIKAGNEKHIIILTQCRGYVKKPAKRGMWYFSRKYKQYPGLVDVVKERSTVYNQTLATVDKLEQEGKAFVFRPLNLQSVSRTERRKDRLEALYNHGYKQAAERLEELKHFLQL